MKKYLKFGIIFSVIYLLFALICYSGSFLVGAFLGKTSPWSLVWGLPLMVLSLFGFFVTPMIVPEPFCHFDMIGCSSIIGTIVAVILNIIFYFLIGALIGSIFEKIRINKKVLAIILIVLAVIIFGFIFSKLFISHPPKQSNRQNADQVISSEASDWKTYTNNQYGFELKYPSNMLSLDEQSTSNVFSASFYNEQLKGQEDHFEIIVSKTKNSNTELINNKIAGNEIIGERTIGGISGKIIPFAQCESIIIYRGELSYEFTNICANSHLPVATILSTFKFTDQKTTNQTVSITDIMITSFLENISDKTVGAMAIKKTLRIDFDNDKREDAVVVVHACGATCYDDIYVLLNKESGIVSIDTSMIPLSKGLDISLQGNLVEVRGFDIAGALQVDQMYEIKNDKLVPTVGG